MGKNEREFSRVDVRWPASVLTLAGSVSGELKNVSLGGALLICRRLPLSDKPLKLSIEVPDYIFPISATVEQVRLSSPAGDDVPSSYGLAVRFTEIAEEDFALLCKAIERAGKTESLPSGTSKTATTAAETGIVKSMEKLSRELKRPFADLLEEAMRDLLKKYGKETPTSKT